MKQEVICDKLTDEIISNLELDPLCSTFIKERFMWTFMAGHEEGRRFFGHSKAVIQLSRNGTYIRSWRSPIYAAKALGVDRSHISQCANKKAHHLTCGGFQWEYSIDYYQRKKDEANEIYQP